MSKELWDSGCWLAEALRECGARDAVIQDLQFAAGQRSLGGDAWEVSVRYANEFARCGATEEHAGPELAAKVLREMSED